jgi:hypothetical protein
MEFARNRDSTHQEMTFCNPVMTHGAKIGDGTRSFDHVGGGRRELSKLISDDRRSYEDVRQRMQKRKEMNEGEDESVLIRLPAIEAFYVRRQRFE